MSLFPAYSNGDPPPQSSETSLEWLCNTSCPPEIGQPPSAALCVKEDEVVATPPPEVIQTLEEATTTTPEPRKKKKKDKKKTKNKKRKKKKRKTELNESSLPSSDEERRSSESRSNSSLSRSTSRSPSGKRVKKRSRIRYKEKRRSKSKEKRSCSTDRSRSSRSVSVDGSRLRPRKKRSRSRSRRRSRSRSRLKSRKRSRSRRRSRSSSRLNSRSRSRRRSRSRSRRRSRSRSRSRLKSRKGSRSRRRSRSRSRNISPKIKTKSLKSDQSCRAKILSSNKSVFIEGVQGLVKAEDAFFITTEGDANNKFLATTHYTQLARYKNRTKGELGNTYSNPNSNRRKKVPRYFKKGALRTLYSDPTPVRTLLATTTEHESYVPLSLTHAEERRVRTVPSSANSLGIYDSKTEEYIAGTGGLGLEDDAETHQDAEYEMWQRQAKDYNERLGKEPHNVPLWLEFVGFQDASYKILYQGGNADEGAGEGKRKKVTVKALAERKISILDSAIKKNMRNLDLYFERLQIGKDLWDDKTLKQEWDTLVFSFPNKISVWHRYLSHAQTHFTSFSLASAVRMFGKCAEKLQQMRDGVFLTHSPPQDIGGCLVGVSVQLAHVWRQGGYFERSVALFQALVELNLFCPKLCSGKDVPMESKLAIFEAFWDSRAARFGEVNAVGWSEVIRKREAVQFPEVILEGTVDEEDDLIAKGGTTSALWLALETSREQRHWLPWEQDPEDCEDPERMVALDELLPHLFILNTEEEKFYLVSQFLRFFGVPDVDGSSSYELPAPKNPGSVSTRTGGDTFRPLVIETLHDANLFGDLRRTEGETDRNILSLDAVGPSVNVPSCDDYYQFLCRAIQQATSVFGPRYRKHLTLLYIKLLGTHFQTKALDGDEEKLRSLRRDIKKQIKGILKSEEFRTYLPMYREYGKVEEAMGHVTEAGNVYVTALAVGTSSGNGTDTKNEDFAAIIDLYLSYVRLEINREVEVRSERHINNVLHTICSLVNEGKVTPPNGSSPSGGNLLKAKRRLHQLQNQLRLTLDADTSKAGREGNEGTLDGDGNEGANGAMAKENERVLGIKAVTLLSLIQLLTVGFRPACLVFESAIETVTHTRTHKVEDTPLPSEKNSKNAKNNKAVNLKLKILESLYEDYLWIVECSRALDHLVKDGRMSPLCLRSVLDAALRIAPHNTRFLLLLAKNQSWRNLIGGLETLSSKNCSIVTLVSRLLPHIQKTITLINNTSDGLLSCGQRLENVLEQSVQKPPGSHCPLLWRLYLALVAATRPKGLKNLTYRALIHCPGVKSVYLDCVRLLPSMLREVVKLITEKGMRVRIPLEELEVLTEKELEFEEDEEESEKEESNMNEEEEEDKERDKEEEGKIEYQGIKEEEKIYPKQEEDEEGDQKEEEEVEYQGIKEEEESEAQEEEEEKIYTQQEEDKEDHLEKGEIEYQGVKEEEEREVQDEEEKIYPKQEEDEEGDKEEEEEIEYQGIKEEEETEAQEEEEEKIDPKQEDEDKEDHLEKEERQIKEEKDQ